jgi:exodeoxyribonuclease V alpha subunit
MNAEPSLPPLAAADLETVEGTIKGVRYTQDDGFTVGAVLTKAGEMLTFAGKMTVSIGDAVTLTGIFDTHPKYGRQLKVSSAVVSVDLSSAGLADYLAKNPTLSGIGPTRAKKIAEAFGDDFARMLEEEPARIAEVAKLPLDKVKEIRSAWRARKASHEVLIWLAGLGLTYAQAVAIEKAYGADAPAKLKKNPYLLARDVRGFGFLKADEVALKMGTARDSEERIAAACESVVHSEIDQEGHTWVSYGQLTTKVGELLSLGEGGPDRIDSVLGRLVSAGRLTGTWLNAELYAIGTPKMLSRERELGMILPMLGRAPNAHRKLLENAIGSLTSHVGVLEDHPLALIDRCNDKQRAALTLAAKHCLLVITGSAGTGKTFTMARIAEMYASCKLKVGLAAPTGKASVRMAEMSQGRWPASTLHRLLGYKGDAGFDRSDRVGVDCDDDGKLDLDVLLLDECSMLDLELTSTLFEALDTGRTALVMFGDPHQLPSVGAGSVLRDLVQRKMCPVVTLETVVRQAGVLRAACGQVLVGKVPKSQRGSPEAVLEGQASWPWLVIHRESETQIAKTLEELFTKGFEEKLGIIPGKDIIQVLAPSYKGSAGVDALNESLQRILQKKLRGFDVPQRTEGAPFKPKFYPSDRVIQTRNNYELGGAGGVMNGTVGSVVRVEEKELGDGKFEAVTVVDFDGTEVEYSKGVLSELALAYALTVHKAQGSEFPYVVVVSHKSHSFMLNRNLLYTAVTRAQRVAMVIGDPKGIELAAARTYTDKRRTMLGLLPKETQRL